MYRRRLIWLGFDGDFMSVEFTLPALDHAVPFDGSFVVDNHKSAPGAEVDDKKQLEKQLKKAVKRIAELQKKLYADNRFSVLLVFQAMDAAGKDGTIRAVMSGVNPAGCQVHSFKSPSDEEIDHDFLWRTAKALPERGRIGIFNRSYYEEVLAVKVNPEFLKAQRLPSLNENSVWADRFESIRDHELHLTRNGTVVLKFWLNVSKKEQKARFLKRLTEEDRHWKFSKHDLGARKRWSDYMSAYQELLNETSTQNAPWFAVPADSKPYMRLQVAKIIEQTLTALPLAWPEKSPEELSRFGDHIEFLNKESD